MRSFLAVSACVLGLSACATPARHTGTNSTPAPRPDACSADRARVAGLLARGKLERASRVIDRANRLCPRSAPESWQAELGVLMDLGIVHRVRFLVTDIEKAEDVPVWARTALPHAKGWLAQQERDRRAPVERGDELLRLGLAAKRAGDIVKAQRLIDAAGAAFEDTPGMRLTWDLEVVFPDVLGIEDVAWSPAGDRIAATNGNDVVVIDAKTRLVVHRLVHTERVAGVAFSPDGARIATAALHSGWLWDAKTGEKIRAKLDVHQLGAQDVAFSPDGTEMTTGAYDGLLAVFDGVTGELRQKIETPKAITSVAYSPDGARIVVGAASSGIWPRVIDRKTGKVALTLTGHTDEVVSASFSPDGSRIASASRDGTIRLYDAKTGNHLRALGAKQARFGRIAFSPDSSTIASTSWAEPVTLWDLESGQAKELPVRKGAAYGARFAGHAVTFSPDGKRVVAGVGRSLHVWNTETSEPAGTIGLVPDEAGFLAFTADSRFLEVTDPTGKVARRWALSGDGALVTEPSGYDPRPPSDRFAQPVTSPDGKLVARALFTGCVELRRTTDDFPVAVLCTLPDEDAGLVFEPTGGGRIEPLGKDPCAARALLDCEVTRVGFKLPIDLCEERFYVRGLLPRLIRGEKPAPVEDFDLPKCEPSAF